MAWNHLAKVYALAIAIQSDATTFAQPNTTTDVLAVASPTNTHDAVTAEDPTGTGTFWDANRVYFGKTATVGGSVPFRGHGGSAPPAANAYVPGRLLQAGAWAEIRKATATTAALGTGSTTTALVLANTESASDDTLNGFPIQHAAIGSGFQQTTLIQDYAGTSKTATLAETLGTSPSSGTNYTIPPCLVYQLGTGTGAAVYLSISLWRDKKRYDYRGFQPQSLAFNMPVANEANTSFSDMAFSGKCQVQAVVNDTTPQIPLSVLNVPIPPIRDGKFYLDRVKLGHQMVTFTQNMTVSAASNQNQAAGQDAYDMISGNRQITIDLNQMAVDDFDLHAREDAQTAMSLMSTWGLGQGNRFGFMIPGLVIDPFSPGDRNGYVSISGNAYATHVDKSATLAIW